MSTSNSPRRSSLSSASSSTAPRPVKTVRFSFPVTILEAPACYSAPSSPDSPTFSSSESFSSEDDPAFSGRRRRLARLLLGPLSPPPTGVPPSPTRAAGIHAGEGRVLLVRAGWGSRVLGAMRSPTALEFVGLGKKDDKGDGDDEEEEEEEEMEEEEMDVDVDVDVDPRVRFGALPSYHHQWHMRWLEIDEDAD